VIPKCLLEKPYPPNILTVPSCTTCNAGFSKDEEYFLAVMAMSGTAPSLQQKVDEDGHVDRMLRKSAGLDTLFLNSTQITKDGRPFIAPDEIRIANVTRKTAFGLYLHRYTPAVLPALDEFLALKPIHESDNSNFIFVMSHDEKFRMRRWNHVQTIVHPGKRKVQIFDYMFVRNWIWGDFGKLFCIMRFHETIWSAVRCPHPPNRKSPRSRLQTARAHRLTLPHNQLTLL
jgi:hypothetical protein